MKKPAALLLGVLAFAGCDDEPVPGEDAGGRVDAGGGMVDAGSAAVASDMCGDAEAPVFDDTFMVLVDTTSLTSARPSCGITQTPGQDAFIAVDVVAGDQWHFHVTPMTPGRDPYVLWGGDCNFDGCAPASAFCEGTGDEHFSVTVETTGRFHLGVDDHVAGGGVYQVYGVRGLCGDGIEQQGEACDGGDDCDASCRRALVATADLVIELEPNDNLREANVLPLTGASTLDVMGMIGGDLCTYADFFAITVPEGSALEIDTEDAEGLDCDNSSLTPFDLLLLTGGGDVRAGPLTSFAGCAEMSVADLAAGTYYVQVWHPEPLDRLVPYRLEITVTAP